jgi:transposase
MQWERIRDALPGRVEHVGRTTVDNRQFVNAVLWVLRSGTRWHDLPERYAKSVHARFMRWARAGVWERIFADLVADKKNQHLMIDSTIVRAHQQAATDRKRGLRRQGSGEFPRWTEHQGAPARGRSWSSNSLPHHGRTGCRIRASGCVTGGRAGRSRDRRQGLRLD